MKIEENHQPPLYPRKSKIPKVILRMIEIPRGREDSKYLMKPAG
jgi:hypothetical protein